MVRDRLKLRPVRRALFETVLALTRMAVVNRENLRLARTRTFGLAKRWYRQVGRALAQAGLLERDADVFYLSMEEMKGAVRGHLLTRDLKALVALRKREYEDYARRHPPDRITLNGVVFANEIPEEVAADATSDDGSLRGIGCAGGRVTGRAMIVRQPRTDLDVRGEILVATMTDPGWVFLMAAAGGLVVERGSLLSHTAIIGRELGVPTVVGVTAATRRIADGELLEIDGGTGEVRRLERESGN
jgi:pyruvate,water dikinase